MKKTNVLVFVVNCIVGLGSLFRICTGRNEFFDYFVVFFTFPILVYDVYRMIKLYKEQTKQNNLNE